MRASNHSPAHLCSARISAGLSICMDRGRVNTAGIPIVCLPHRLTIEIQGGNIDG